jgi:UDP-3-O-[3-hydroxymyristoyl] glucosamine N-acyltransferase
VQDGTVLGADGFGFEPDAQGRLHKIPQAGVTVLGDDVEVQALSAVDRASLGETRIGRGTKVDNFVQVGHSTTIGEDTIVCAHVGLAGTTRIGNRVVLAGQVGLAGHLTVGDGCQVAAQSGVGMDLEPGKAYGGSPAVDVALWRRQFVAMKRLPEALRTIQDLARRVATLEAERPVAPPPPGHD